VQLITNPAGNPARAPPPLLAAVQNQERKKRTRKKLERKGHGQFQKGRRMK
jgi:uncharacterized protein YjiS (DUF1127 family)